MIYNVEITETLQRIVKVSASDEREAVKLVRKQYRNEDIVLDSNDYIDTEFDIYTG
jgi:flagellar biosynthesis regulator FlbT